MRRRTTGLFFCSPGARLYRIGGLHRISLLVRSIGYESCKTGKVFEARRQALEMLHAYAKQMRTFMSQGRYSFATWAVDLEGLYSVLPNMHAVIIHNSAPKAVAMGSIVPTDVAILERSLDIMNSVGGARSKRCVLEMTRLSQGTWNFLVAVAAKMFFGVAWIDNGSVTMDLTMCFLVMISICYSLYLLAELDSPYRYHIKTLMPMVEQLLSTLDSAIGAGAYETKMQTTSDDVIRVGRAIADAGSKPSPVRKLQRRAKGVVWGQRLQRIAAINSGGEGDDHSMRVVAIDDQGKPEDAPSHRQAPRDEAEIHRAGAQLKRVDLGRLVRQARAAQLEQPSPREASAGSHTE